ncbi:MAG: transcriptional repressor NrdR [Deltaproteobacteria bacterium]|nr:transcriptional repressor NrdR [Deltaproteobacteria bacterium]
MKCPYCGEQEDKVIDSRPGKGGEAIRRRRECIGCGKRFTSYETVEKPEIMVIKKDGRREAFNAEKVRQGMIRACEKRPVSVSVIDSFVETLIQELLERGEKEIPTAVVGEKVMDKLRELDAVAYVRFASVYREFKDVNDFFAELKKILDKPTA